VAPTSLAVGRRSLSLCYRDFAARIGSLSVSWAKKSRCTAKNFAAVCPHVGFGAGIIAGKISEAIALGRPGPPYVAHS
jgi:hypothetical protein